MSSSKERPALQRIGPFTLVEAIGKGGMAEIFRAEEALPDGRVRPVAIKRLFPRLSADREFVRMFVNEARLAARMQHPNIVRTFDLINTGSYYYIVMEFLEGADLEDILHQGAPGTPVLSLEETAFVVSEVARGLDCAHRGGHGGGTVVHRDISPGNILIGVQGEVKITDFGIARALEAVSHTQPGILKGKYEYMAPEYVQGKEIDGRADLFSLGVVLYEMLTTVSPFAAVLAQDVWDRLLYEEPEPPSRKVKGLPRALDGVAAQALAKEPAQRFQDGEALARALQPFWRRFSANELKRRLGERARQIREARSAPATEANLAAFLPPGEGGGDRTQEIHVDEVLDLVAPGTGETSLPDAQVKPRPTLDERGSTRRPGRPVLVLLALLASAVVAFAGWGAWRLWLRPDPVGFLSVTSDEPAHVWVNGEDLGAVPLSRIALPVGSHEVEVRRASGGVLRRKMVIEEERESTLAARFRKPPRRPPRPHKKHR
ncbi:MAG: protein kinase [Myxococcales bacterium]|nr:protein kinase [Myxococcales bacterium]